MGGILGLCTPAGGPCGAEPDDGHTYEHRQKQQRPNTNIERVPSGSQDIYHEESGDSGDSVNVIEESASEHSRLLATKKVTFPDSFIAKHIMPHKLFKSARERTMSTLSEMSDIDKVEYRDECLWLQGADSLELDRQVESKKVKRLLDVVIWRIPIIPAFSYFESDSEFYELVFDTESPAFINTLSF